MRDMECLKGRQSAADLTLMSGCSVVIMSGG